MSGRNGAVRHVVLVHGAYADGSSWSAVIRGLQARGFAVRAMQNPLTSLADDVASTRRALALHDGPSILVGHSYGGAVITEAGADPRVAALVYVSARAPGTGEDYAALAKRFPTPPASAGLVFEDGFGGLTEDAFLHDFANGVEPATARVLYAAQGRIAEKLFSERVAAAAWTSKPSWYAITSRDRTTSPELPHGRLVGGSSSINGMMWTRGDPSDFDGWAQAGAPGWSYADLVPYFLRVEGYADGDGTAMGRAGPVNIESRAEHGINPAAVAFIDAAEQRGHCRLDDFNGPEGIAGVGPIAVNVKDHHRFGAREAYILPALERDALELWADTRVIEVNVEHGRCVGVTLVRNGSTIFVGARSEVILSASSVETPKLLMLSGIGPEDHLREVGAPVRHSLPGVGGDFHDHVSVAVPFETTRHVPLTSFPFDAALFFRSEPDWVGADLEAMCSLRAMVDGEWVGALTIRTGLVRPMARGTIRLQSVDPTVAPLVDPRFLSVDTDIDRLAYGVRETLAVTATSPMTEWVTDPTPIGGLSADMDDRELRAWLRSHTEAFAHMAGGCRMGLDERAVVDPELKVHGLDGLRVADVSVMPAVPSAHSQAAIMAIAERISDVILGRRLPPNHAEAEARLA